MVQKTHILTSSSDINCNFYRLCPWLIALLKLTYPAVFFNRHRISAWYKYLVKNFDFAEACVLVGKPIQYELFPVPHTLLFRFEKGRKKGKAISKIY